MPDSRPDREPPSGAPEPAAPPVGPEPEPAQTLPEPERCDVCDEPLEPTDPDEGYAVPGRGVYLWTRGDEVRRESVPLCPACATGIGVTALARWEIEEEEG